MSDLVGNPEDRFSQKEAHTEHTFLWRNKQIILKFYALFPRVFSFSLYSLRDKPEKFTEDTESLRSTTPDDQRSVVSTTSTDAVIIEGISEFNMSWVVRNSEQVS